MSSGCLYGGFLKVAHLRAESNRAPSCKGLTPIGLCSVDTEQRMMWKLVAIISTISAAFDKHMRWFAKQNHLAYTPLPPIIDPDPKVPVPSSPTPLPCP